MGWSASVGGHFQACPRRDFRGQDNRWARGPPSMQRETAYIWPSGQSYPEKLRLYHRTHGTRMAMTDMSAPPRPPRSGQIDGPIESRQFCQHLPERACHAVSTSKAAALPLISAWRLVDSAGTVPCSGAFGTPSLLARCTSASISCASHPIWPRTIGESVPPKPPVCLLGCSVREFIVLIVRK